MSEDLQLLHFIYENAKMGSIAINDLVSNIHDDDFLKLVNEQKKDYDKIYKHVEKYLKKHKKEVKDLSVMAKISTYISIKMDIARDGSLSHLAEMMIKGSNMGIIQIKKQMNLYHRVDEDIMDLAQELLKREEQNLEDLKPYL